MEENGYNDYNEENVVTMDKYISFFAESEGVVYDNLVSMINNEFNEYAEAQEPIIFKTFDGNSLLNESLDFNSAFGKPLLYVIVNYFSQLFPMLFPVLFLLR